jgi:hypothetical protein
MSTMKWPIKTLIYYENPIKKIKFYDPNYVFARQINKCFFFWYVQINKCWKLCILKDWLRESTTSMNYTIGLSRKLQTRKHQ